MDFVAFNSDVLDPIAGQTVTKLTGHSRNLFDVKVGDIFCLKDYCCCCLDPSKLCLGM